MTANSPGLEFAGCIAGLAVIGNAMRTQLEKLIRLNKTHTDFTTKFEELIESHPKQNARVYAMVWTPSRPSGVDVERCQRWGRGSSLPFFLTVYRRETSLSRLDGHVSHARRWTQPNLSHDERRCRRQTLLRLQPTNSTLRLHRMGRGRKGLRILRPHTHPPHRGIEMKCTITALLLLPLACWILGVPGFIRAVD